MNVGFYAAKAQAQIMRHREDHEFSYERYKDTTRFWAMIDLVGSSNYRLLKGEDEGYVRGETFFSLVNEVTGPYTEIEILKEIGDASLLSSDSLRPLLEALVLADQVAHQMRLIAGDEQFPFAIRGGISYGPVKQLKRPDRPRDYLGSPLDQLARILGVRVPDTNLVIHEAACQSQEAILEQYSEFLTLSSATPLTEAQSKGMLKPVYYRRLFVDGDKLREFRQHFVPWRETT